MKKNRNDDLFDKLLGECEPKPNSKERQHSPSSDETPPLSPQCLENDEYETEEDAKPVSDKTETDSNFDRLLDDRSGIHEKQQSPTSDETPPLSPQSIKEGYETEEEQVLKRSETDDIFDRLLSECKAKSEKQEEKQHSANDKKPSIPTQSLEDVLKVVELRSETASFCPSLSSEQIEPEEIPFCNWFWIDLTKADYASPICPIHSRLIGLFDEMPPDHCYYKSCPFYINIFCPEQPSESEATLAGNQKKVCKRTRSLPATKAVKKAIANVRKTKSLPLDERNPKRRKTANQIDLTEETENSLLDIERFRTNPLTRTRTSEAAVKRIFALPQLPETETSTLLPIRESLITERSEQTIADARETAESAKEVRPNGKKWIDTPKRETIASKRQVINQLAGILELQEAKKTIQSTDGPEIVKNLSSNCEDQNSTSTQASNPFGLRSYSRRRALQRIEPIDENNNQDALKLPYEIGLGNKGNTCFVNATVQCLFALEDFMKDLNNLCAEKPDLNNCIESFNNLAMARQNGLPSAVDELNGNFIASLGHLNDCYKRRNQQDAHEFLNRFLALVRTEFPEPDNPVDQHFKYRMTETFRCVTCNATKQQSTSDISLCLPIPEDSQTLEECLKAFVKEEERSSNCWQDCNGEKMAVSSLFDTVPNILVLTMKRYTNKGKIDRAIKAPNIIDLRELTSPEVNTTRFRKVGEIVHAGRSIDCGHYVANVLCNDGLWRQYDDKRASVYVMNRYRHETPPYIYIYRKCEP